MRDLHDRLYSGPLGRYLLDIPYVPHITIGRAVPAQMQNLLSEAERLDTEQRIRSRSMMLERIDDYGHSKPIVELALQTSND